MSKIKESPLISKARKNPDYRYDIVMLRLFAIVVVVFFHTYGMTYQNHLPMVNEMYRAQYENFNCVYLINIAMPLFVFISGFLYGGQLLRKQPVKLSRIIKGKATRLLLPFFIFTIIFMLTTNSFSWEHLYTWRYWHLWFLPMLFWCFIITYLLRPLIYNSKLVIQLCLLVILFAWPLISSNYTKLDLFGLGSVFNWLCWFVLGAWIYKYERSLFNISLTSKVCMFIGGVAVYIACYYWGQQKYGDPTLLGEIGSIASILGLWSLFTIIPWRNYVVTDYLLALSACSFGIYIFHNWLAPLMISTKARAMLPIEQFAANHIYLFPFLFSVATFLLSLGITWFLLRFKVCRKLIG